MSAAASRNPFIRRLGHLNVDSHLSVNTPVNNPIDSIEGLAKRFGLTQAEGEMVKAAWKQEPVQTMRGVIQTFTGATKTQNLNIEAASL